MKVLILNGRSYVTGNTTVAVDELVATFAAENIETEVVQIGSESVVTSCNCLTCLQMGRCVIESFLDGIIKKFYEADGIIVISPVYHTAPDSQLVSFVDCVFDFSKFDKRMKVAAAIVVTHRGGFSMNFDMLNSTFAHFGMPIVSGHKEGNADYLPSRANRGIMGLQALRMLAKNMSFLIKSIDLGRDTYGLPKATGTKLFSLSE